MLTKSDLSNMLQSTELDKKGFFIYEPVPGKFALAIKTDHITPKTNFMNAQSMNEFLRGYLFAKDNKFEQKSENETKVYVIEDYEIDEGISTIFNSKFMDVAEEKGTIYSLKGFENAFNNEEISSEAFIRII